ncbi:hypothetical protein BX600DRAFT_445431, partial [Xylariales sp. PMI_506]
TEERGLMLGVQLFFFQQLTGIYTCIYMPRNGNGQAQWRWEGVASYSNIGFRHFGVIAVYSYLGVAMKREGYREQNR